MKCPDQAMRRPLALKHLLTALAVASLFLPLTFKSADAGARRYNYNGTGFVLFDLFGQAPNSKYRKPQVRGFNKRVGGYSYKYTDTLDGYGRKPYDFSPIFDRGLFHERIGVDGPYVGY